MSERKKVVVLGAGHVGPAIAHDLSKLYKVVAVDKSPKALEALRNSDTLILCADVFKVIDSPVVRNADLVVSAMPDSIGFKVLEAVIKAGKPVVDISFYEEDPLQLNELAREKGVVAVVDMGVAPGMMGAILGYHLRDMHVEKYECFAGGLPLVSKAPWFHQCGFNLETLIAEYERVARYIENGKTCEAHPLSDISSVDLGDVGVFDAIRTDGLRTMIKTMSGTKNMGEWTLRHPGHLQFYRSLREAGFLDLYGIWVGAQSISPRDVSSEIMKRAMMFNKPNEDKMIMRVRITGKDGRVITYDLCDRGDEKFSSVARTTGFAASGAARLILDGRFNKLGGIYPPELVGKQTGCFEFLMKHLKERGVIYKKTEEKL